MYCPDIVSGDFAILGMYYLAFLAFSGASMLLFNHLEENSGGIIDTRLLHDGQYVIMKEGTKTEIRQPTRKEMFLAFLRAEWSREKNQIRVFRRVKSAPNLHEL